MLMERTYSNWDIFWQGVLDAVMLEASIKRRANLKRRQPTEDDEPCYWDGPSVGSDNPSLGMWGER